jgi:hypothetical protein
MTLAIKLAADFVGVIIWLFTRKQALKGRKLLPVYIRDKGVIVWGGKENKFKNDIMLRLASNNIDKHREYIEKSPSHIKKHLMINMEYVTIVKRIIV